LPLRRHTAWLKYFVSTLCLARLRKHGWLCGLTRLGLLILLRARGRIGWRHA
jgi:hypothetical protein